MGGNSSSGGNGGSYASAQKARKASVPGTTVGFQAATKGTGADPKEKTGDVKEKTTGEKIGDFIKGGGILGAAIRGITKGSTTTTAPKNVDVAGGNRGGDGGGAMTSSGQVVQAPQPVASPTTAEVSQSQAIAAEAQEDITLRKKRILAKGRSPTIMTSPKGAITGSLTLGKPSLLGR
jgi:hypothetical protein